MAQQQLAFIGLGGMGGGMACRLAETGFPMSVYNRTASKADEVKGLGATVAATPAEAAEGKEVALLSLADQHVVEQLTYGEGGITETLPKGSFIVDMSTVSPEFARANNERATAEGYSWDRHFERMLALYEQVAAQKKAKAVV